MKYILRNITITIIAIVISAQLLYSQQNILYFMNGIQQSHELNPAYQYDCQVFVGIPGINNINFNVTNTGFTYNEILRPGTGLQKDSLIIDWDNVKGKLGKNNYIVPDFNINILSFGFRVKKNYFTFGLSNKTRAYFSYPKDLVTLIEGNGSHIGASNPLKMNGMGVHAINYTELAFGMSRQIDSRLTVGGKMKILLGTFAVTKQKTDFELYTGEARDNYKLTLKTDIEVNAAGPITVKRNANGKVDNVEIDEDDLKDNLFSTKNKGLAFDLGATYQLTDKIKLYASVIDLGYINWKKDTYNFYQKGEFVFEGIDVDLLDDDSNNDVGEQMKDSIENYFEFDDNKGNFKTWLSTNIYIGGTYELTKGINLGLLSKTYFYNRKLHQGVILSANFAPVKWFNGSISYSMINRSYSNIGLGMGVRLGSLQFYMLSDYITSMKVKTAKAVGIQFGFNMYFGCKKRVKQFRSTTPECYF